MRRGRGVVGGGCVLLAETKSKEAPATRRSLLCVKERMVPLEEIKIFTSRVDN